MLPLDFFPKRLWHILPYEHIHSKREIAFVERLAQICHLAAQSRFRERYQIEIGRRPGRPFHSRSVGPDLRAGQVGPQQVQHRTALSRCEVDLRGHSQLRPVMVWYSSIALWMKFWTTSRQRAAFSTL